jgi:hypothetical protein
MISCQEGREESINRTGLIWGVMLSLGLLSQTCLSLIEQGLLCPRGKLVGLAIFSQQATRYWRPRVSNPHHDVSHHTFVISPTTLWS